MKRLLMFMPLLAAFALGLVFYMSLGNTSSDLPSARVGQPLPAFELSDVYDANRSISQRDLKGHISLVNVWATWCPSCQVEHPYLLELAEQRGVVIYGLNYKDERDKAQDWLQRLGDPYRLNLFDPQGRLGLDLGVYGAPETYLLDAEGVVRYRHVGVVNERVWQRVFLPLIEAMENEAS